MRHQVRLLTGETCTNTRQRSIKGAYVVLKAADIHITTTEPIRQSRTLEKTKRAQFLKTKMVVYN